MTSGSDWYRSDDGLLTTLRDARRHAPRAPTIPGYDGLLELGRGGQGVVYQATQRSTRRMVAIKVLLDGAFASEAARHRFEREIDLVALLQHPNVVRLYDSGTTADGHPYYVMEYVEGVSLDVLIDSADRHSDPRGVEAQPTHTLDVRSTASVAVHGAARPDTHADLASRTTRLYLFEKICAAVNYAHQRGVLHRDLKPSNIRIDATGEPHVLDFGLAKVTLPTCTAAQQSNVTLSGQFMGSLPWASPEQAEGRPELIDIRTDVYSLGVLLYQLLTGHSPYKVTGPLLVVIASIKHAVPQRPRSLMPGIDEDLETIVLKALAKERERRYQSAGELAQEIRRYLNHEPIEARRGSTWYTLGKTLQRYRLAATIASTLTVIAVGVAVTTSVLYGRAVRAERTAEERRAEAENEADKARRTQHFLEGMFGALDPLKAQGRDVGLLRELLNDAAKRVDTDLGGQPEVEASVRATIGRTYASLGDWATAESNLARALDLYRRTLGESAREALTAMNDLSGVYQEQGRFKEAEPLVRTALEGFRKLLGPEHRETFTAQNNLAFLVDNLGDSEAAETLYRQTLDARRCTFGDDDSDTIGSTVNLAQLLLDRGQYAEATPLLRQALEARRRTLGPDHPDTLTCVNNLARVAQEQNQLDDAATLYAQALDGFRPALGDSHPRTLMALSNLAVIYRQLGRLPESETLLREGLALQRRSIPDEDPAAAALLNNLARTLHEAGKPEEAEPLLRRVYETLRGAYGDEHPRTLSALTNLAGVLKDLGRLDDALELSQQCAEIRRRVLGPAHPESLLAGINLAANLRDAGRLDDALTRFDELTRLAADLPVDHWLLPFLKGGRGEALVQLKRFDEAELPLLESYAAFQASVGDAHPSTRRAAKRLFDLYQAWGRPEQAAMYAADKVHGPK